ncbi:MAG: 3-methyladenine DNA glycosylase [Balneolaceae bacterium]|nr:3-methyladenine DNA glycosylase [Balneolaceae bacterium]
MHTLLERSPAMETLPRREWQERRRRHRARVSGLIDDYLQARQRQEKDPVMDFLFEYYAFRPSHLKRWSPGFGVRLEGVEDLSGWELDGLTAVEGVAWLDPGRFPRDRLSSLHWILGMLKGTRKRAPNFGCYGMHEWAMVYKADQVRHEQIPLRMEPDELARFVESRPPACTHFDAFRFFTEEARPLNRRTLNRDSFAENEQPGCLHTNMDLYKWAFKFQPWISGEALLEAFELALRARIVDMKASPYDLRERGLEPIRIETPEGRREYVRRQNELYEQSRPVRKRLIREYGRLAKCFGT